MTSSRGHRALALAVFGALAVVTAGCSSASPSSAPTPGTSHTTSSSQPTKSSTPGQTSSSQSATPAAPHATEFNPPGDIPDNAVFVDHSAPGTRVHFTVPEGWAQSTAHGVTTFTDKYNSVSIQVVDASSTPTVASAQAKEIPELRRSVSHFTLQHVETVSRAHGNAVHITYLMDSQPNPVTGKVVRDAVERFEFWHGGQEAILSLTGPQNADNVDPWQIVSDSLQWK